MDTNDPISNPDTLPDSTDPNGPCRRCGRMANFALSGPQM